MCIYIVVQQKRAEALERRAGLRTALPGCFPLSHVDATVQEITGLAHPRRATSCYSVLLCKHRSTTTAPLGI